MREKTDPSLDPGAGASRESEAAALARLYDVDLLEDPGDLGLYIALAARTGGPILELAAGSGRIAVPLAAAGYDVTAVDLDPAMLARARRRAGDAGPAVADRLTFVEADLITLGIGDSASGRGRGASFGLAIVALNSILLLGSRSDQQAAFETMARHLVRGGVAVVDVLLPTADELARYDGRIGLEYVRRDPETGLQVVKTASAEHDPVTGRVTLTTIFDEGEPGGQPRRWVRQDALRLVGPDELRAMAEASGLVVETMAGTYELDPLAPYDDRVILVARRSGRARGARLV